MFAKLLSMNNPNAIISNPILFDASCSGIQHIAALTLEKELASNVNVYSNSSDPSRDFPQDFYIYALEKMNEKLSVIEELKDIKLNRKMIKSSVMTIPYNISLTGVGEHLMEHFESNWILKQRYVKISGNITYRGEDLYLSPSQFGLLTKIVYFVLTKELPSLRLLSDYFNSMMNILIKLGLTVTWITPSGLKISYTNIKFETTKVKAKILNTSKFATIKLPTCR